MQPVSLDDELASATGVRSSKPRSPVRSRRGNCNTADDEKGKDQAEFETASGRNTAIPCRGNRNLSVFARRANLRGLFFDFVKLANHRIGVGDGPEAVLKAKLHP